MKNVISIRAKMQMVYFVRLNTPLGSATRKLTIAR